MRAWAILIVVMASSGCRKQSEAVDAGVAVAPEPKPRPKVGPTGLPIRPPREKPEPPEALTGCYTFAGVTTSSGGHVFACQLSGFKPFTLDGKVLTPKGKRTFC